MSHIQVILAEPYRTDAANNSFEDATCIRQAQQRSAFRGPIFAECKYMVKEGVLTVSVPEAVYHYPLHTIVRIKEIK